MTQGHSNHHPDAVEPLSLLALPWPIQRAGTVADAVLLTEKWRGCVTPLPLLLITHVQ